MSRTRLGGSRDKGENRRKIRLLSKKKGVGSPIFPVLECVLQKRI